MQALSCDHVAWRIHRLRYRNPLAPRLRPHLASTLAGASVVPDLFGHAVLPQDGPSPTRDSLRATRRLAGRSASTETRRTFT